MSGPAEAPPALVVSCEHGGHRLPAGFTAAGELAGLLPTHRGWDPGALGLARALARGLGGTLRYTTITRLAVDANREEAGPEVFSAWSAGLSDRDRERLLARYHRRHRGRVRAAIVEAAAGGRRPVVHVGVHSFTPVLDGAVREVDVGVLLDPARGFERRVARAWLRALRRAVPELRVAENAPYDGRSDGLTTTLRGVFPEDGSIRYAGLELEVSQGLLEARGGSEPPAPRFPSPLVRVLRRTLSEALELGLTH